MGRMRRISEPSGPPLELVLADGEADGKPFGVVGQMATARPAEPAPPVIRAAHNPPPQWSEAGAVALGRKCVVLVEDEEEATLGIFAARRHRALHSPESLRDFHQVADSERAVGQPHLRRSVAEEHHFVERHLTSRWVERTFGLVGSYTSF
jgi:hypothetical protein